jgi:hypothetical protein
MTSHQVNLDFSMPKEAKLSALHNHFLLDLFAPPGFGEL